MAVAVAGQRHEGEGKPEPGLVKVTNFAERRAIRFSESPGARYD
jgi:hypothetical protein